MNPSILEFITSSTPFVAVVVMALLVAINPCPLATVVSSILYLTGRPMRPSKAWWLVVLYIIGRAVLYFTLGMLSVLLLRTSISALQLQAQILYGLEHFLGPIIILLGGLLWMFGCQDHKTHHHDEDPLLMDDTESHPSRSSQTGTNNNWRAVWLGFTTALFFCPATGLIYFGMLVPMTAQAGWGFGALYMMLFALLTASVAYPVYALIRMGLSRLESFAGSMQRWRKWLNRVVAILFILIGSVITVSHLLCGHSGM